MTENNSNDKDLRKRPHYYIDQNGRFTLEKPDSFAKNCDNLSNIIDLPIEYYDKNIDFPIGVDGICYVTYQMSRNNDKLLLQHCEYCWRFYDKSMITAKYDPSGLPTCYHCVFMLFHHNNSCASTDEICGKTITEYIIECKDTHNKDECTHVNNCFVCDFLNRWCIKTIIDSENFCRSDTEDISLNIFI